MKVRLGILVLLAVSASSAQNPTTAYPNNYKMLFDNTWAAVLRVHYGPHETVGVHDHSSYSTVYVYLNDSGAVRFTHSEEAKPFTVTREATHTGAFRVSPGRLERHSVENLSDQPSDFLRVELKHLPVHSLPAEFRGPAPKATLQPGTTVAYDNPKLRIERTVCPPAVPCKLTAASAPSILVVSGTTIAVKSALAPQGLTTANPIAWLPAQTGTELVAPSGTFQVLRIFLLNPDRD